MDLLTGHPVASATHGMPFTVGLGTLAGSGVVLLHAVRREGTVVWSEGSDGGPHRRSPTSDRLHEQVGAILDRP